MKLKIKGEQQEFKNTEEFKIDVKSLDLQENEEVINICIGRIESAYPTYILKQSGLLKQLYSLSIRKLRTGVVFLQWHMLGQGTGHRH